MQKKTEIYKTILVINLGFIVLYFISHSVYFLYVALAIAILSVLSEWLANFISEVWMKLAKILSYIVPPIIMSLVFFCILTPMALLQRLFKKNKTFHLKNNLTSTFVQSKKIVHKSYFEKPW